MRGVFIYMSKSRFSLKLTWDDFIFKISALIIVWVALILTLYPFIYVFSSSISSPVAVMQNKVFIWPVGFNLTAYKKLIEYPMVLKGYYNTILYTVTGTFINMLLTVMTAYPLARKSLVGRKGFVFLITFTLLFNGGLIPTYLVVRSLGMVNTRWAMIIPNAMVTWNVLLMKTFFESMPNSLIEAAIVEGSTEMQTLYKIVLPLSKPAIATISLFYAVRHWNSFFPALIYLNNKDYYPIQLFLRQIVLESQTADVLGQITRVEDLMLTESLKYATIMIVTIPILIVYPFIQKYFVKGIMVGSVKG